MSVIAEAGTANVDHDQSGSPTASYADTAGGIYDQSSVSRVRSPQAEFGLGTENTQQHFSAAGCLGRLYAARDLSVLPRVARPGTCIYSNS